MLDEGIKILAIYTSGSRSFYNYASQLTTTLGHARTRTLLTERHYPKASHLFHVTEHRREAVNGIAEWAEQSFGCAPGR